MDLRKYITPKGAERFRKELDALRKCERPKIVELVAWAAGNGDRSENGDYIYGKRRLREIDRRIRFLSKRLEDAEIVDPVRHIEQERVYFGALVTVVDEREVERSVRIVGCDEAETALNEISLISPLGRALIGGRVGDEVRVATPAGVSHFEIIKIRYLEMF